MSTAQEELLQKRLEERERCRRDKLFLAEILGYDFQADVHAELFAQYIPFVDNVSYFAQSEIKNRMVLWSRGHYKTTSVVVEIIQTILNFPDIRILIMQGSLKTTMKLLREIGAHFLGAAQRSRLYELFPEFCGTRKQLQMTQEYFIVPCREKKQLQQATVTIASPKATKTGQHYDVGFFDDLVNDQNYRNPNLLQKVQEDFDMCIPLIDPGGYRYVTGTRYAFGDLYEIIAERALKKEGTWKISIKTCYTDDGLRIRFPQRTSADGRVIGFSREKLDEIKSDDPGVFSSQYLNQPIAASEQLFTEQMMLDAVINPDEVPPLSGAILFIDLASGDKTHNDDSVIFCGRCDSEGIIYFTDCVGGQWPPAQLALQLIMMALKHRPIRAMIEKTASCAYFVEYLQLVCHQKGIYIPIDYLKVNNLKDAKAIRIASLQGLVANKRIRFFPQLQRWDKILEQFVHWPRARYAHDDYPDTVALAIQNLGPAITSRPLPRHTHPIFAKIAAQDSADNKLLFEENMPEEGMGSDFGV